MKSLYWLPIAYLICFKLSMLMHDVHNRTSPSHLTDTTTPLSSLSGHRPLHSAMMTEYDIPRTRTQFLDRAFSVAVPRELNCRYKEPYRLVILQTSHQDTLFCIGIFGLNIPDCTMFDTSGQFLGGCKMRHINGIYLLTY